MKKKKCTLSFSEQKAIVLDCMERVAQVRREITKLFPVIEEIRSTSSDQTERCALRIYQDHTIGACTDLADIYAYLVEKEACYE